MKKRLEAELISIAHRVLKLKNKSEIDQLYYETQKLYEALTVLKFYGDNYEQVKSAISNEDIEGKIESFLENKTAVATPNIVVEETVEVEEQKEEIVAKVEEVVEQEIVPVTEETEVQEEAENLKQVQINEEPVIVGEITLDEEDEIEEEQVPVGEAKSDLDFEPIFELAAETPVETLEIEEPKKETKQISFEDLLGQNYTEPVFVKPNDVSLPTSKKEVFEKSDDIIVDRFEGKTPSLNDKLSKTITIGLNDRMGFVKFLFADSNEDYNRVLSQLNTFSTYREAKDFIDQIIKPDYNNWVGAEDYADRFIELVEKKFL
ncbi:hypothetical protein [Flavobacterium sp.]|uniref:hypothetical protein n=1 Tax=Flavobacterium sp. TaxID=239 RepID=UPI00260332FB|nr:hypothetical protein [Flavobacterium sp.]